SAATPVPARSPTRMTEPLLGLRALPPHLSTVLLSAGGFTALHLVLLPTAFSTALGARWTTLPPRSRTDRCATARATALTHALLVVPLATCALGSKELNTDRVFGWSVDGRAGAACAVAAGYFIWDTVVSAVQFRDGAFVLHGALCGAIYLYAFRPFLAYYAVRFLLWELSTPFLHIHWFLDKLGHTGSSFQRANGAMLLCTFAGARLVYGPYMSYHFLQSIFAARAHIHPAIFIAYVTGNVLLNTLNFFWFYKMIVALHKRFKREKK
ncbi:TLC domain-containing protein, partial [Vararia minispora EC-137]